MDVRSACVAAFGAPAVEDDAAIADKVASYRSVGAPLVFALRRGHLELWKQATGGPKLQRSLAPEEIDPFFELEGARLAPEALYRAKTLGRFQPEAQLDLVDLGFLQIVETELGQRLSALIEELVGGVRQRLGPTMSATRGQWMLREVFWLLAAKILHDKAVPNFQRLRLEDLDQTRERIARHYGARDGVPPLSARERAALAPVGERLADFASLGQVTTEALAFVYENALVSDETRKILGTHSTPTMLVDYVVGRLSPHLDAIPPDRRRVFEPACGHAPFLVSAMRALRDRLPPETSPAERKRYLRQRLVGLEVDAGALEIARLALTLADIPNPNGWNLHHADLFEGERLEREAAHATVLLSNPPYEDFSAKEREQYMKEGVSLRTTNKAFELLERALPGLPDGALVGLVLQRSFLQAKQARRVREVLVRDFHLLEITQLPEKLFELAHHETVVILARRGTPPADHQTTYRRVREHDRARFRNTAEPTSTREVPQRRFAVAPEFDLRVPDFEELWNPRLPRAETIAEIGQGLTFKSASHLPSDAVTWRAEPFDGSVPGFLRFPTGGLGLHALPRELHFNLSQEVIGRPRSGATVGVPQVLLPYAPAGLGAWRLTAHIDREGHAVTSRFLVVRPADPSVPLEYLWSLFTSPYANAYAFAHLGKRDNLAGAIRAMPVPAASPAGMERVTEAARAYLGAVQQKDATSEELRDALLRVDAEVLRLYGLPAKLERTLLRLFDGFKRPGVPFSFDRYFPPDFESAVPLHLYLSEAYRRATPDTLLSAPPAPRELVEALKRATEEFGD